MGKNYVPTAEGNLLGFTNNFASGISGTSGTAVGLTAGQVTNFASLNTAWANAYAAVLDGTTRSPAAITTKNQCKDAVVSDLRQLAQIIQKNPAVTDQQRQALGLTVPSGPTPIGPPTTSPAIEVRSSVGRTVTLKLHDAVGGGPKPAGVKSAQVYSYVGTAAPEDVSAWTFEGGCSRSFVEVVFPNTVTNGAQVWFTGCWVNERQQPGPATTPVTCNIPGGAVSMAS